ncbi:hypothetical protein, partial [Endozoicomonas sp. ONNA2]|uniref:hypothetical protein n=1 Tax=Endozoicomonas sp. ONNA2 TaxID=2828741 RepID=UPI0021488171
RCRVTEHLVRKYDFIWLTTHILSVLQKGKLLSERIVWSCNRSRCGISMNKSDLDTHLCTGLTYSQALQKAPSSTNVASSSYLSRFSHSVQKQVPLDPLYLNPKVTNQKIPCRLLSSFSIFHLPPTENKFVSGEYSREDIALPGDFTCEQFDNDFTFTDLTSIHAQQTGQRFLPKHSSVTLSQPSLLRVATVGALDTPQQVLTETVQFKASESSDSGRPVPLTPEDPCFSESGMVSRAKYEASDKHKTSYDIYGESGKKKAAQAKYRNSVKGKASIAKNNNKYNRSDRGKAKQAVRSARAYAIRRARKQGLSETLAREKGELAAKAKKAELSSLFPTLFSDRNEGQLKPESSVTESKQSV